MHRFPRAVLRKQHKLGGLRQEIYCVIVLEATSQNQGCWQGRDLGKHSPLLSLASGGCRQPLAYSCITPVSAITTCLSLPCNLCVQISLFIRIPVIGFRVHTTPVWPHFDLLHLQTPFPNTVTFTGTGGEDTNISFWGHGLTCNTLFVSTLSACLIFKMSFFLKWN